MDQIVWIGLFLPLVSFLLLMFSSDKIGRQLTSWIACSTVFISFLSFTSLFFFYTHQEMTPFVLTLYKWIPVEGIDANFALRIDPLSLVMTLIITGVGFLIHVYSVGYMEHEEDYARYFACMNLFIFAMLLLVLAANLLLLFVGWEGVGLASFLLIGFWYHRPAAAEAATKAFIVNRIGDCGLLIGLLLTFHLFGGSDIDQITAQAEKVFAIGAPLITLLTFLYFFGASGKSAQIPLHTWLPDAMEGPTPVSALIHAATMVTAGVYLVVRMHSLFLMAPYTMQLVGVIGGVTSLFAALSAVGQIDLKRVLAYSTVSQLGLMFLACGTGAFYAAMFHLTTHAFVKGLLFLSAGNVVHMMNGTTNMENMGGLSKIFTKTKWFFLIGVLSMSGIPPLSIFFSKDLILEQEYATGYKTLFFVGLATSILTAFYLMRAYCITFMGAPRLQEKILKVAKEAPYVMLVPVSILAFLAVCGGLLGFWFCKKPFLESFLNEVGVSLAKIEPECEYFLSPETAVSIAGALLGVGVAALLYTRYADRLGNPIMVLRKAFYFDAIYSAVIVMPLKWIATRIANFVEPKVIEGSIEGVVETTQGTAQWLQKMQSGQIRSYVAWMVIGMVLLIGYFIF